MSLRFLSRDSQWVRGQNQIMHRSIRKFIVAAPLLPRVTHGSFTVVHAQGVGNLNLTWMGWGI